MKPNAMVTKDDIGLYKRVTEGITSYSMNYQGRYIICVKADIYKEYVIVDERKDNILLYGEALARPLSLEIRIAIMDSKCHQQGRS
jgi:pectinesterase